MNHSEVLPLMLQLGEILFLAMLYLVPLRRQNGCVLLTIPVQPEFFRSDAANRLVKRYVLWNALLAVLAVGLAVAAWSRHSGAGFLVASCLQVAGLPFLWAATYRAVLEHRVSQPVVRTASLTAVRGLSPAWFAMTLAALLPLLLSSAFLAMHYDRIPFRYASHWGWNGEPNRWTFRSHWSAYQYLIPGVCLVLMLTALGWITDRYSVSSTATPRVHRFTRVVLCACTWFVALAWSALAVLPLLPSYGIQTASLARSGAILTLLFWAFVGFYGWRNYLSAPLERTTPAEAFVGGMFYYNPSDAALLVPKRMGLGYTINFARPMAWLVVAGIVLVAMLPMAFVYLTRAH